VIRLLVGLYPARWRERYGHEFEAVLSERPLGPFDVADVLLGALDAHLHLRGLLAASEHRKGFTMSLKIGGVAAVISGILWFIVLAGNAINDGRETGSAWLGLTALAATITTLLALAGLSAFQSRRYPVLTWAAFAIPAAGAVIGLVGFVASLVTRDTDTPIGGVSVWLIMSAGLLTLLVGSGLFALATLWARTLSRAGAALLAVGALGTVPALAGLTASLVPEVLSIPAVVACILALPVGWTWLGLSAIRIDRAATTPAAGLP
jgi:hypothetical protein